jgi:hypothetical protein
MEFTADGLYNLIGQIKTDIILLEAFSNWHYVLPSDPEKMLYDFYFLTGFIGNVDTRDEKFNYAMQEAISVVVDALAKNMLNAVRFSISSELRHHR